MTDSGQRRLDPQTVEELYAEFAGSLKPFLWGLLRNAGVADEALQNTFRQALRAGGDVDSGAWKAWLFRVAYNEAMAIRRRQRIDSRALQEIARASPRYGLPPDESAIQTELRERLQTAIAGLPVDQQLVVVKRTRNEQTFQQIADELGLPLGTVLTRMRLALAKLRAALQEPND